MIFINNNTTIGLTNGYYDSIVNLTIYLFVHNGGWTYCNEASLLLLTSTTKLLYLLYLITILTIISNNNNN